MNVMNVVGRNPPESAVGKISSWLSARSWEMGRRTGGLFLEWSKLLMLGHLPEERSEAEGGWRVIGPRDRTDVPLP